MEETQTDTIFEVDEVKIYKCIVDDLSISHASVINTVGLLEDDATVPFIARYRKERTGALDETQIRAIEEKWNYYGELEKRKAFICSSIFQQGKLTEELSKKISDCREKQKLEDLYLPYKPKKRTKATIAKEQGLEPLADIIWLQETVKGDYLEILNGFVNEDKGVNNADDALNGALDIIIERINDDADIRGWVRAFLENKGFLSTTVAKEFKDAKTKFEMYYDFTEKISQCPSHRILAIRRGAKEGIIRWNIEINADTATEYITKKIVTNRQSLFTRDLLKAIPSAYKRIFVSLETEVFAKFLQLAEAEAIRVFSKNLHNLLLESPAGHKVIMGIDPGFRTGCKVAVVDDCGKFLEYNAIFPHPPQNMAREAASVVLGLIKKYGVRLIAIGNGTASRETMSFVNTVLQGDSKVSVVMVSEAGASVYSASEVAINEFPELDVTVRGAISIARRLQDPLAELVKIDPKSIGVGQYQHDVNQPRLKQSLDTVVESCVNFVGVEVNTASRQLLAYVSGIGPALAQNIVEYRAKNGSFKKREELLQIPKLGDKAYEQAAGFLRVRSSANRLDNSAIHPERYGIVREMAEDLSVEIDDMIGNEAVIKKIDIEKYVGDEVGLPTLEDIIAELLKPGLDPREEFQNIEFDSQIQDIEDLQEGMELTGKVTNVTNFGAFVDIGVHQDGLIHISKLSRSFVKDPYKIVAVGDTVKVKVLSVDTELKRISLERIEK